MVFTGEAWGFLGSRRFLLELDQHSDAVSGLDFTLIEMVLIQFSGSFHIVTFSDWVAEFFSNCRGKMSNLFMRSVSYLDANYGVSHVKLTLQFAKTRLLYLVNLLNLKTYLSCHWARKW